MTYEIDQSGKIEDSNKLTIVALANGKTKTLKIGAVEKQKLIKTMRILDYPRKSFIYKMFAGLVFLLLKDEKAEDITIDKEYPGHEGLIKAIIIRLFQSTGIEAPSISFSLVGKDCQAHKVAIETFRGIRKPDLIINAKEVLGLFYRSKGSFVPLTGRLRLFVAHRSIKKVSSCIRMRPKP